MLTPEQAFALALEHHQAGRLADAEALYRQILAAQPAHFDALQNMGVLACQVGRQDVAVDWLRRAIAVQPANAAAHSNLGEACRELGRLDEAEAHYRRALEMNPDYPEAHNNLGNVLCEKDRTEEAIAACRRALALRPDFSDAHNNLGIALMQRGALEEAIASCRRALELQPAFADASVNLGTALCKAGRFEEAASAYREALRMRPAHADAYNNLSIALFNLGQLDESAAAIGRALEIQPDFAEAYGNLSASLLRQGLVDESVAASRRSLELCPDHALTRSGLIYALHLHPDADPATIAREQQQWDKIIAAPLKSFFRPHDNHPDPDRKLRIGYVSPDFRAHAVGLNVLPLLRRHDAREFEVICYSEVVRTDGLTEESRRLASQWRNTLGLADDTVARMIRQDEVDILVDLAQHTGSNRLPVFARRPAPVQLSFAGYPDGTGLEAIPHRISDRWIESCDGDDTSSFPPSLIPSFWCYEPRYPEIAVSEMPAAKTACVTFGSLNNFAKTNEPLLQMWAQVLREVAHARLVILAPNGSHRERVLAFMRQAKIDPTRIEFVVPCPYKEYLETYQRIDVALDTFPYNGHTTSLDASWMGVPVVSLAGQTNVSRGGRSILTNLGLPELIAGSPDEYVHIASQLAGDLPRLAALHGTLRSRMEASVLMNAALFTRSIEEAYRRLWRSWCATRSRA
jgi:predicted O-linked N-acetylglucosamine transferase (SPINDLY family)